MQSDFTESTPPQTMLESKLPSNVVSTISVSGLNCYRHHCDGSTQAGCNREADQKKGATTYAHFKHDRTTMGQMLAKLTLKTTTKRRTQRKTRPGKRIEGTNTAKVQQKKHSSGQRPRKSKVVNKRPINTQKKQRGGSGWFGSGDDSTRCGSLPNTVSLDTDSPVPFGRPEGGNHHAQENMGTNSVMIAPGSAFPPYQPTVTYPVSTTWPFSL